MKLFLIITLISTSSLAQLPDDLQARMDFYNSVNNFSKAYSLKFDEKTYNVKLTLSNEDKEGCDNHTKEWQKNKGSDQKGDDYDRYNPEKFANNYPCAWVVQNLTNLLLEDAKDLSEEDTMNMLIAFVNRNITYQKVDEQDYWKTPYETLTSGIGDCEDSSFLLSQMMSLANFDSLLVGYPKHINVCVKPNSQISTTGKEGMKFNGSMFYMCESTSPSDGTCWKVGQYPQFVKELGAPGSMYLVPKNPIPNPVKSYQYTYEPRSK